MTGSSGHLAPGSFVVKFLADFFFLADWFIVPKP
jgi:hypothetical protein